MSVLIWIGCGVLVADVVVLAVVLAAMSGRADARLEAMAVRRWLTSRGGEPAGSREPSRAPEASGAPAGVAARPRTPASSRTRAEPR